MKNKKNKQFERRLPKTALNVVEETAPGQFQVYQLYGPMKIPLLGRRIRGEFVEDHARTVHEAFDRLYSEYYQ